MLLYMVFVWGSIFSVIKFVTLELPLNAVNAIRFILIGIIFSAVLVAKGDWRLTRREAALVLILGLIGFGVYQLLSAYGINLSVVAGSSLILAATPIFTTLFSGLFRVEQIARSGWLGVLFGFLGIALIVAGEHGLGALVPESVAGELAVAGGAACWALGAVVSKPLMRRHSSVKISAYGSVVGCAVFLPFLWNDLAGVDWSEVSPGSVLLILYWVFAGNFIGQLVRFYGVKKIGPHRATAYIFLVPFSASAIAAFFVGSPIGVHHLAGGAVIFAGIALTRMQPRPATKPPAGAP